MNWDNVSYSGIYFVSMCPIITQNFSLSVMMVETFVQQSFNVLVGETDQAWYSVIT